MLHVRTILLSLSIMTFPVSGYAHGGGTDANGCHRDSSSNTRHCHGADGDGDSGTNNVENIGGVILVGLTVVLLYLGVGLLARDSGTTAQVAQDNSDELPDFYVNWEPAEESGMLGIKLRF